MTPFLILVLKLSPVYAVGTDLMFAAITKITGGAQHIRQNTSSLKSVTWLAIGSLPASFIAARVVLRNVTNTHFVDDILPDILGAVLLVVGILIFVRLTKIFNRSEDIPVKWPSAIALISIGAFGGFLVGLTSIGGGTVIMALLVLFFVIPPEHLVGLDVTHGAVLALFSATTYALAGHIQWNLLLWMIVGSIPGVLLGSRMVVKIPQRYIRGTLAVLLILAGINLLLK